MRKHDQTRCPKCYQHTQGTPCSLTPEDIEAISEFARAHGDRWRNALRQLWETGKDEGSLRRARNVIGPTDLAKVIYP